MTTIRASIKRHPVLAYYLLTFAISWGGVLVVIFGRTGIQGTSQQVATLFPFALLATLAGPCIAGILLTGMGYGMAGLRDFLSRLLRWRAGARWYAVALLTIPVLAAAVLSALSLASPVFLPSVFTTGDKATLLLSGIAVGLSGASWRSWAGRASPSPVSGSVTGSWLPGLLWGFLWGAWHVPVTFWSTGDASGVFSPDLFLPPFLFYVAVLPAYRVLMVWLYDRTASLLVAMLMHASLTASTLFILAPPATGVALMTYYLVLAAALWVVGAVAMANSRQSSRQSLGGLAP